MTFVAPGPEVTSTTPGLPVARAYLKKIVIDYMLEMPIEKPAEQTLQPCVQRLVRVSAIQNQSIQSYK